MRAPAELYVVYIVHVGPKVYEVHTKPDSALKAMKKLLDSKLPAEFSDGIEAFGQKMLEREKAQINLTLAAANQYYNRLAKQIDAWSKRHS